MRRFILVDLPFWETPSRRRLPAFHQDHLDHAAKLMCSWESSVNFDLIPSIVEHDCTTDGYSGLVLHEMVECAVMVASPSFKERTCLEKHFGELFEGQ